MWHRGRQSRESLRAGFRDRDGSLHTGGLRETLPPTAESRVRTEVPTAVHQQHDPAGRSRCGGASMRFRRCRKRLAQPTVGARRLSTLQSTRFRLSRKRLAQQPVGSSPSTDAQGREKPGGTRAGHGPARPAADDGIAAAFGERTRDAKRDAFSVSESAKARESRRTDRRRQGFGGPP